jgi:DDE superfamily endonuclease
VIFRVKITFKPLNKSGINMKNFKHHHQKLIASLFFMLRPKMKSRLGRKCSVNLTGQITITMFKLHYNLPDRILEDIFKVDHVTIHRIFHRILKELDSLSHWVGKAIASKQIEFYITDSTTLPIGKGKNNKTFSGYKHHHGVKFQVLIDQHKLIHHVSDLHDASEHDKSIFEQEWQDVSQKIQTALPILADKAYVGLTNCGVTTPVKRNEKPYKKDKLKTKEDNKALSSKRIKVEHVFASLKSWRILKQLNFYGRKMIGMIFQSLVNIYNLNQLMKLE